MQEPIQNEKITAEFRIKLKKIRLKVSLSGVNLTTQRRILLMENNVLWENSRPNKRAKIEN